VRAFEEAGRQKAIVAADLTAQMVENIRKGIARLGRVLKKFV